MPLKFLAAHWVAGRHRTHTSKTVTTVAQCDAERLATPWGFLGSVAYIGEACIHSELIHTYMSSLSSLNRKAAHTLTYPFNMFVSAHWACRTCQTSIYLRMHAALLLEPLGEDRPVPQGVHLQRLPPVE